jgi:hypothetical protein
MCNSDPLKNFIEYSESLAQSAWAHPEVLGLVLVGSAADTRRVDEWSDHDFFLVVKAGAGPRLRQDISWLPNSELIAIASRETAHGLKVVYQNGHVLEFAVFEDPELELASVNYWAVPVDKANITDRVRALEHKTQGTPFDEENEWGLYLALILIAVGRARRGEVLIAGQAIRSYYLKHVLGFVRDRRQPVPGTEGLEDNLDRFRRFEKQYPVEAARIEEILELTVEQSAKEQLELVLSLGGFSAHQLAQAEVVKNRLGWTWPEV